jgi:glycosyltransferase involved in cell wall biosynthesis
MPLRTSIAVCTYNGERFLQQQLDSLLAQSLRPDEIVLRDDASSDGTMQLVDDFVARAHALGIRVDARRNASNLGYRRNFEQAIQACTGELIFLCDQDDVWESQKLQTFVDRFQAVPDLLLLNSDARLIDGDGHSLPGTLFRSLRIPRAEIRRMHHGQALQVLLRRNLVTGAATAFRSSLLPHVLPLPATGWVHDAWMALIAAMMGRVDTLTDCTIAYRLHANNQLGVGGAMPGGRRAYRLALLHAELVNTEYLMAQLRGVPAAAGALPLLAERIRHLGVRTGLGDSVLGRLAPVTKELLSGRYGQFSRGNFVAAADLLGL